MTKRAGWIDRWERIAWQGPAGAGDRALAGFLRPLEFVYRRFACRPTSEAKRLPCPVISVGNLTCGGSGKTPFTVYLARRIRDRWKKKVAVVSRGYGKANRRAVTVVSDGRQILAGPEAGGDEACLVARAARGTIVVTAIERSEAARRAIEDYGAEVILLDDGFQHRRLERQLDLVLVDGERGFGNGRCLPAGPLREPLSAMARADWVVVFRRPFAPARSLSDVLGPGVSAHKVLEIEASLGSIRRVASGLRSSEQLSLQTMDREQSKELSWTLASGIAYPESFRRAAEGAGLSVAGEMVFQDHHRYTCADWQSIVDQARRERSGGILATEKDFWKLLETAGRSSIDDAGDLVLAYLELDLTLSAGEAEFDEQLARVVHSSYST